jgi:hypothetical protein
MLLDATNPQLNSRVCECGCGRSFVASNGGSPRRFFETACQRRAKQRKYNTTHPEQRRANAKRYQTKHKDRIAERSRRRYAENIERERERSRAKASTPKAREQHYQRTFGISLEEYTRLLQAQEGKCAICGSTSPGPQRKSASKPPSFSVDHDHKTGAVRGLLCEKCNRGLGQFEDDPARLIAALAYLRKAD